jgi:hypothetical protein
MACQPRTRSCGSCQGTPSILNISSSVSDATRIPAAYEPGIMMAMHATHTIIVLDTSVAGVTDDIAEESPLV